jgi:tRNA threonylcarbamoyl adenosine modification protein YjeE
MSKEWISHSEEETVRIAAEIANKIQFPSVICLHGDLGSGKTAFSRALIRLLLQNPDMLVPSPTYTLVQTYDDGADIIWHFDLYRLENSEDIYDIGWEDAVSAKLCLIEWPERLGSLKPKKTVDIHIDVLQDGARRITLKP